MTTVNRARPTWKIKIEKMPYNGRFRFPVFRWVYDSRFCNGGELFTNISKGELVFKKYGISQGKPNTWCFTSVEEAMVKINEYKWEKPPYIDEVFQKMVSLEGKFPMKNTYKSNRLLAEVQEQWEHMINKGGV